MSEKSKGTLCGIVAAVSYGMNPLGALSLYRAGINTNSVLFYRYALAAVLLAALLLVQKTSLRITRREFSVLGLLGVMFAVSSLTLFMSFHYMDAGIASTLLFVYPVMVVGHILFENVIADVVFYDFLIYPVCVVRFLSFPFRRRSRLSL